MVDEGVVSKGVNHLWEDVEPVGANLLSLVLKFGFEKRHLLDRGKVEGKHLDVDGREVDMVASLLLKAHVVEAQVVSIHRFYVDLAFVFVVGDKVGLRD